MPLLRKTDMAEEDPDKITIERRSGSCSVCWCHAIVALFFFRRKKVSGHQTLSCDALIQRMLCRKPFSGYSSAYLLVRSVPKYFLDRSASVPSSLISCSALFTASCRAADPFFIGMAYSVTSSDWAATLRLVSPVVCR